MCSNFSALLNYGLRDYGVSGQLGLEPTLEEYIHNTVTWAREVWRVLRDDGTFWLNIGDSYAGSGGAGGDYNEGGLKEGQPRYKSKMKVGHGYKDGRANRDKRLSNYGNAQGLKPKDLMGVPWRVALALQADGWYLRSDIIWFKPNPRPESVTDRPTKSHEYLFLLTKQPRYYYDADAIREPQKEVSLIRLKSSWNGNEIRGNPAGTEQGISKYFGKSDEEIEALPGRNKRTVWTVTTKGYKGAHFATFPPDLIEPCIKAGSAEGDYVFDPFLGSGTTAQVARDLGRVGVGTDLSGEYLQLARERLGMTALDEWENGPKVENTNLENLPLFE